MSIFNPFHEVFTQRHRPHAHVLRTSLSKKLADTFFVLTGKFGILSRNTYAGIFDYLTFYLTPAHVALYRKPFKTPIHNVALALSFAAQTVLFPLRYLFGAVFTAAVSPIVAITHLLAQMKGNTLIQNARNLRSTNNETLDQLFSKDASNFEDYHCRFAILSNPKGTPVLLLSRAATGMSDALQCEGCMNGGCDNAEDHSFFTVDLKNINGEQNKAVRALIDLNFGGLTEFLAERGLMNYFMDNLDRNFDHTSEWYQDDKTIFSLPLVDITKTADEFFQDLIRSVSKIAPFTVGLLNDYLTDASVVAITKKLKDSTYFARIGNLSKIARGESNAYDIGLEYAAQNTPESRREATLFLNSIDQKDSRYKNAGLTGARIALIEKDFPRAERWMKNLPSEISNAEWHLSAAIKICKRHPNLTLNDLPNTAHMNPDEKTRAFFQIDTQTMIQRLQQEKHPIWHANRKVKKIAALQELLTKVQGQTSPSQAIQDLKSSPNYDPDIEAGRDSRVCRLLNSYSG